MTLRASIALRNYVLNGGSFKNALQGGRLKVYSGAQPATPEAAPTGTLLVTITDASGANTAEVRAQGTLNLDSGASGSINTLTVNSLSVIGAAVPFNSTLSQTATDLAAAINAYESEPKISAVAVGPLVTLTAPLGKGAVANGWVVAATVTTIGKTEVNIGTTTTGVTAVNGLKFGVPAAGIMDKLASQSWSGVAGNSNSAGWFRFEGPVADSGALDTTESQIRLDGAISTSGAQINMSSTTITAAATQTVTSLPVTWPAS